MNLPPPDYSKDIAQVFQETTAKAIDEDKSLTVLYHATGASQKHDLPSWVPDWNDSCPPWYPMNFFFRPSGESPVMFELLQDGKHLCLWGKTIDTVDVCTPTLEAAKFIEDNQRTDPQTMLKGTRLIVELLEAIHQWIELALESSPYDSHRATLGSLLGALLYSDLPLDDHMDEFVNWLIILLYERTNANGDEDKTHPFHVWLLESTGSSPPPRPKSTSRTAPRGNPQAQMTRSRPPDPTNSEDMAIFANFYNFDNPGLLALVSSREFKLYQILGSNMAARAFQNKFIRINRDRRFFCFSHRKDRNWFCWYSAW